MGLCSKRFCECVHVARFVRTPRSFSWVNRRIFPGNVAWVISSDLTSTCACVHWVASKSDPINTKVTFQSAASEVFFALALPAGRIQPWSPLQSPLVCGTGLLINIFRVAATALVLCTCRCVYRELCNCLPCCWIVHFTLLALVLEKIAIFLGILWLLVSLKVYIYIYIYMGSFLECASNAYALWYYFWEWGKIKT